jgi:GntR family transcriptional regulator/MocR family aminotransferase
MATSAVPARSAVDGAWPLRTASTVTEALGAVRLAVEDPGHEGIRGLFAKRGLRPIPVRVEEAGIVVSELPDDARAVLLTPAHQFPTGAVLSAERRAELLRWADERGALLVEDDYDAEYRYDRAPIGALQGLRPDLVAHVGSVSKTLAPALWLGWLIAPPAWRDRLVQSRESLDHGLPALEQLALADFITRGAYVAPGPSGLLISFAAVPDAAAGHVAELIASAL